MAGDKQSRKAPTPFGNYLLYEEIGRGGMARVFRAGLRGLAGFEKKLVVKQILPELASDPRFVELLVREATTVVSLSHPHIVPVYDLGLVDGVYFLSMEYVEGATLAEVLRAGPLSPALAAHVGVQLSDALAYAHLRAGLVHRDVTPRNIMLDANGHARLLDFGIAAPAEGAEGGEVFGSPGYMSPEQARGDTVDGRSDVFSLVTSLYRALTGEEAFRRAGTGETRQALLAEARPSFAAVVDEELRRCLEPALALRPEQRPDAQTLGRGLRSWLAAQHPEGVAEQLGERAERASAEPKDGPETQTSDDEGAGRDLSIEVQTLATRPAFAAMLQETDDEPSTRRMQAREPEPGRALQSPQTPRRFAEWRVAVGLLALVALGAGAATIWPKASRTLPSPTHPQQVAEVSDASVEARVDARVDATSARVVAADAGVGPPPDAAPPIRQTATLTVTATPWANVRLDGRSLGTTPLRSRRVSAGGHMLTFDNPPLGRQGRRRLRLSPGQTLWIRLDLAHDPPTVLEH